MIQKSFLLLLLVCGGCVAAGYGQLTLPFECYSPGTFVSRGSGFNLLISRDGAFFALAGKPGTIIRMHIIGANADALVAGEDVLPSHGNYLVGENPTAWRTNVDQFASVRERKVLPLTDIRYYYSVTGKMEYDLLLRPGADVKNIRLRFEGDGLHAALDPDGNLRLKTAAGEIVQHQPRIEQDGKRVEAKFQIEPDGDVRFQVGKYNRKRALRIDPVISYSTYLGGTSGDSPNAIAVDATGNAYITGATSSFNFPVTPGALQTSFPPTFQTVAFVAKLNPTGTGLVYTTFLGGSGVNGGDSANAIAVDASGNAYVAGTTGSANFPVTQGALSSALSGPTDAFVAKINPAGTALVYGTYLGGSGAEVATGIAIDSAGNAYITGSTGSTNFPVTSGAPQRILKSVNDAFVAKLNPTGAGLVYSTYLGGSAEDDGHGITVDSTGSAYVTGSTASTDFPVTSTAFQKTIGPSAVAFAVKVNPAGTGFTYATFLGGTGGDSGNAIALDAAGNAYIAGTTFSADLPTTAGVLSARVPGSAVYGHAFLSKLSATGATLVYSTYLGGANADGASALALDTFGNATLTGFTNSSNFPVTANPAEPVANFNPAGFLTTINQSGTATVYSTMLGATGSTLAQAVALDATNHAYVAGYTGSLTFPGTPGTFQSANGSASPLANTGFVMKLDLGSAVTCALSFSPGTVSFPVTGGAITVSVVAPSGCAWEAIPGSSWITVNAPSSMVGPGTITITAGSNEMSLANRSATVNAGSAALTVTQVAGSCSTPQLSPPSPQTFAASGGTGSVAVAIPPSCPVTASSALSWLTVNSGASATGNDLVTFTVAANPGIARSGTITIAGNSYTISQAGTGPCGTSLTPTTLTFGASGGSLTASLVVPGGCTWTVSSSGGWLTVSPASGTGSAMLTVTLGANTTPTSRNSTVTASGLNLTATQAGSTPAAVSVAPGSGAGTSQIFTAVYYDTAGATALTSELFLINSTLSGSGACWVQINPTGIFLYDDDSAPAIGLGPVVSGATYANKQCTIYGTGSGLNISGNTLTLTLSIAFKSSFAGPKGIYMNASDASGNSSGWQTTGSYTVGSGTPAAVSATPVSGAGFSQVFAAVYSDTAGAAALTSELFLISSTLNGSGACWVQINPSGIFLYDDDSAPAIGLGPVVSGATYANKQCTINGTGSGVIILGNTLTLTLSIAFKSSFTGPKGIYMMASDASGNSSGWQTTGSYTVGSGTPAVISVTPNSGEGMSQVFTAVYSDTAGASALNSELFLINSTLNGLGACWVQVNPSGIFLYDDDSAPAIGLGPVVSGATYANKQCTINGTGSGVIISGNTLTLTLSIAFKSSFTGPKGIYMMASGASGSSSGWQTTGSYTVGSGTPAVISVTPNSGEGMSQVFTAVYSDTAGASALNSELFLINSTLNGLGACWVQVNPSGIFLYDDDDSAPAIGLGPIIPGTTYSNKQCTIYGAGSSLSSLGNTLTLKLSVAFDTSFVGPKSIYTFAGDVFGNNTGWQLSATFTVP